MESLKNRNVTLAGAEKSSFFQAESLFSGSETFEPPVNLILGTYLDRAIPEITSLSASFEPVR